MGPTSHMFLIFLAILYLYYFHITVYAWAGAPAHLPTNSAPVSLGSLQSFLDPPIPYEFSSVSPASTTAAVSFVVSFVALVDDDGALADAVLAAAAAAAVLCDFCIESCCGYTQT